MGLLGGGRGGGLRRGEREQDCYLEENEWVGVVGGFHGLYNMI